MCENKNWHRHFEGSIVYKILRMKELVVWLDDNNCEKWKPNRKKLKKLSFPNKIVTTPLAFFRYCKWHLSFDDGIIALFFFFFFFFSSLLLLWKIACQLFLLFSRYSTLTRCLFMVLCLLACSKHFCRRFYTFFLAVWVELKSFCLC